MTDKTKQAASEMLDRALKNYEQALRVGLKVQEEVGECWNSTLTQATSAQDLGKRMKSVAEEVIPTAQKRMEEYLALIEQTNRAAMDVFKKSIEAAQITARSDRQSKLTEAWEGSLNAVKSSAQSLTDINQKVFDSWISFMKKHAPEMAEPMVAGKA
ncbi:MAG: hypothetical protein ACXWKG_18085 [Limisphaerales bacterium]